jgi:hypothetical protein
MEPVRRVLREVIRLSFHALRKEKIMKKETILKYSRRFVLPAFVREHEDRIKPKIETLGNRLRGILQRAVSRKRLSDGPTKMRKLSTESVSAFLTFDRIERRMENYFRSLYPTQLAVPDCLMEL